MTKTNKKFKGLFKGAALGFAFVLCGAFFPMNAVKTLAEQNWQGTTASEENTHRIEVDGEIELNDNSNTVIEGDEFVIPQGEYFAGTNSHIIGTNVSGTIDTSKVEVIKKGTNDLLMTLQNLDSFGNRSFEATESGTYIIRYTVVDNGVEYSYDFEVTCNVASEATFEFLGNEKNIIPSVYDKKLASSMAEDGLNNDIILPLPTVKDADGKTVLSSADSDYYTINRSSYPTGEGSKDFFVYISLTGGSDSIAIEQNAETGEYFIEGDDLLALTQSSVDFKITYTLYQVRANGNISFVASTSREFTVENDYYYMTNEEKEGNEGYELSTSWATTPPDSAVIGQEVDLPSINATTRSTNSPASEEVEVYYDVQVMKMDDKGSYTIDVSDTVITDDFKFKATEEGSYRFIYTVRDFYGHTVSTSNTTFYITNVRDSQQATAHIYDAGMASEDRFDENGDYIDVSYKLKTQNPTRNIIMYAIAGTDNKVEASEITLRREIRDASSVVRFNIDDERYNDHNLIFAPGTSGTSATMDNIYLQIVQDNYEIYKQMIMENQADDNAENDLSPADANDIKQWLLEHDYLLVSTSWNKDAIGNAIVSGEPAENDEDALNAMIEAGYAYIKPSSTRGNYVFTEQNYTFYYYANDNVNDKTDNSVNYTVRLSTEVSDASIPTLTFPTDLQTSYLPTETITFDVATASDTIDSRIDTITAYRYIDASGDTVVGEETNKTLKYVIPSSASYNQNNEHKWFVADRDPSTGLVTSENWYYSYSEDQYSIDLRNAPSGAVGIEILAYAIDDYGNIGFFNRVINIASTQDSDMPVLNRIENAPELLREDQNYSAPQTITLPTIYYTDSNPEYMHARVTVYKVDGTSKRTMQSSNMSTKVDSYRGMFIVQSGVFNASSEGTYQVVVTVVDSSNHTHSTYFTYYVGGTGYIEEPEISNITSETVDVAVDTPYYLEPPTITVSDSDSFGYIGLDTTDDSNTSTYYTTTMVSSSFNDYELTQSWFTGKSKGTYRLRYQVFLIRYRIDDLLPQGENDTNSGIYLDGDGRLKYKEAGAEGASYFIYFDLTEDGQSYQVTMNTDFHGNGTTPHVDDGQALSDVVSGLLDGLVDTFTPVSQTQTIIVSDVGLNISIDSDIYEKTQYPTIDETDPETLPIVKPEIVINGNANVDLKDSYVQITCTSGNSTVTLATINFEDWEKSIDETNSNNFSIEGNAIYLRLIRNGQYTIRYSVQAEDSLGQNIGEAKTLEYTFSNGDVVGPDVNLGSNFVNDTYRVGNLLILNFEGFEASDEYTKDETYLKSHMTVTLTNNDTSETWNLENQGTVELPSYEHQLDDAGDYTITVSVTDRANNTTSRSASFTVTSEGSTPIDSRDIIGGVLIGVSVAVLAGVVIYFVVSKVKLDKREKGYRIVENSKDDSED